MKKYLPILLLVFTFCVLGGPLKVFAQSASTTPTTINARILPTVWYSTLSVNDGDSIKIYAGIQNNSGINFTGTATFYVDDKEILHSPFSSTADSLKDVSVDWVANPGAHSVQVKILTSLASDKALVSYESETSSVNIVPKITAQAVQTAALNTASDIVSKVDDLANSLADTIDSFKKPADPTVDSNTSGAGISKVITTTASKKGSVLGTSTSSRGSPTTDNNQSADSVFNMCIGLLSFLVRNWMWTLLGIFILFLFIKIISRGKK